MSLMGWSAILLMVGVLGLIGLRLAPVYIDYYYVLDVAKGLASDPSISAKSRGELNVVVAQRFRQNNLYEMNPNVLKFTRNPAQRLVVTIDYEERVNIFGNLDMVATFHRTLIPN